MAQDHRENQERHQSLPKKMCSRGEHDDVLNVFIDIQTSTELIQMDTDKMMTYGTFT